MTWPSASINTREEDFAVDRTTGENILARLRELFELECRRECDLASVVRVELVEDPVPGDAHTLVWVRPGWEWAHP
jgi:hypothetical protein